MRSRFTKLLLALLMAGSAEELAAQQRQVTGTVTGSDQAPIPSAQVVVTGRRAGVQTDAQGRFTIQVPAGDVSLTVSRIGYTSRTVTVGAGESTVAVRLQPDVLNLEAVVVTGQATTVKRQNVANAVSVVTTDLQRAPAQTIEKALQGKIAGANISTNSGAPGGGVQISLRGVSSIGGSADPLFIIDGVIVSNVSIPSGANAVSQASRGVNSSSQDQLVNRIADINPNDIESIEVLKGASASAIYGSKASNGVVIIRTRRGQAGATRVNLTQRVGYFEQARTLGSRVWTRDAAVDHFGLSDAEADLYFNADGTQKAVYDNEAAVFGGRHPGRETVLSLSGGTERTRFFVSGTLLDHEGLAANTGYEKEAFQLNLDQAVGSRVQVQLGASVLHSVAARGLTGNDNAGVSYYAALSFTPSFFDLRRSGDGTFPDNTIFPSVASNPAQTAALSTNDENVWRAITSANVSFNAVDTDRHNLRFLANGGVDYFEQRNELFFPVELFFEDDDGFPGTAILGQGRNTNLNLGLNLVYTFTASDQLTARTSLGTQYEDRDLQLSQLVGRNTTSRIPARAAKTEPDGSRARTRDFGMYIQEELLLFDERATLTGSVRADRSSSNADQGKYYYYPKAAASYRFDDLTSWADELKLRVAYGSSGNLPFYGQRFTSALGGTNLEGVLGLRVQGSVGDPDLHPERTTELEGGFDATLFGGNARFEFTGYNKRVTDFIIAPPLAPSTGFGTYAVNAGSYEVQGLEMMLEATPIRRDDFSWLTRTTFATDRAEVKDLGGLAQYNPGFHFGFDYGGYRIKEGESPTALWGNDVDAEGNNIERVFGDAMPKFRMGFANDVTWRNLTLSGLVDWAHGGLVANLTKSYYDDAVNGADWTGCNTSDTCAGAERAERQGGHVTQYLEDGSYVKLREVSLSYQLPNSLLGRMGNRVRSARLTLSGRNLRTWTDYSGLDPEVSNFGNRAVGRNQDVTPFPPSRSVWLSLDLGF
ncbi:MAG TPA: SusC/RagA family TonB-linked outer membrane protein [Longimicrobium sp.]|jgi:TonB-linked SusC/RagA family outer membrane protein